MKIKQICLLIILMNLFACAEQATKSVEMVPVEERNAPLVEKKVITEKNKSVDLQKGKAIDEHKEPVITALLNDAEKFSKQGQSEKAAATIERALRIEPKNALLWHRLAVVRLQQQQWRQAIVMARKSNALAGNNRQLKSDNWGIIAAAYDSLGDRKKANEARNKQSGQV